MSDLVECLQQAASAAARVISRPALFTVLVDLANRDGVAQPVGFTFGFQQHERSWFGEAEVERAVEKLLTPFAGGDGGSPDGWFDWYEVGGRFAGAVKASRPLQAPEPSGLWSRIFRPKAAEHVAYARDVVRSWSTENAPFVVVTPDGVAEGADDWAKDPFEPWAERFKSLVEKYADHLVVCVDAHA